MIIDMDTHILPRDIYDHVTGKTADLRPRFEFDSAGILVNWSFPGNYIVKGSTPLPPPGAGGRHTGLTDVEYRLEEYDKLGIEKQLLLPQFSAIYFNYTLDPELAGQMAHSYNLSILNLLQKYPGRLIGSALVALQDVDGAIAEMEWAAANGFRAVIMDKVFPVHEHCYSDPLGNHRELWPFFKRAEALGMPLFLHNIQHGHRITNLLNYQFNGLDVLAPQEGQMSLVSLVTSGLLDDFPDLKFVFTEAGVGFIKPLVSHLDSVFNNEIVDYESEDAAPRFNYRKLEGGKRIVSVDDYKPKNRQAPSHYFKKNLFFTIETEEAELPEAINLFGASQFLFATDYPHDDPGGRMKYKDVQLLAANPHISEADKALIRSGNAERLLAPVLPATA